MPKSAKRVGNSNPEFQSFYVADSKSGHKIHFAGKIMVLTDS
jgi:hypothetical protein